MAYKLEYKDNKGNLKTSITTSLAEMIMQVKSDFDTNALINIDQLIEARYIIPRLVDRSVMVTLLSQLKLSAKGVLKDQIVLKLDYLKEGV